MLDRQLTIVGLTLKNLPKSKNLPSKQVIGAGVPGGACTPCQGRGALGPAAGGQMLDRQLTIVGLTLKNLPKSKNRSSEQVIGAGARGTLVPLAKGGEPLGPPQAGKC